jgi:ribonuclease VapC
MFVDSSALVAILLREPEADRLADRMSGQSTLLASPLAIFETAAAEARVRAVLIAAGIEVVAIDDAAGRAALDAFERYGKGRGHPAQLNMGDCFAYALARLSGGALLYKGDDFARTDLG